MVAASAGGRYAGAVVELLYVRHALLTWNFTLCRARFVIVEYVRRLTNTAVIPEWQTCATAMIEIPFLCPVAVATRITIMLIEFVRTLP